SAGGEHVETGLRGSTVSILPLPFPGQGLQLLEGGFRRRPGNYRRNEESQQQERHPYRHKSAVGHGKASPRQCVPRGGFAMTYRRFVPVWVSFLLLTFLIAPIVAGTPSESAFKKLQSLAGKWEGKDAHGRAAKTSFDVLASGTAVIERLDASGMEEMVTLYSLDRDGVALVHYGPTNNQPRMRVV